jgi:hypothetical protein
MIPRVRPCLCLSSDQISQISPLTLFPRVSLLDTSYHLSIGHGTTERGPKAASREDEDTFDPPSANRAI